MFKIGDRVRCDWPGTGSHNKLGSILAIESGGEIVKVQWDHDNHTSRFHIEYQGHTYILPVLDLSPMEQQVSDYCNRELGRG